MPLPPEDLVTIIGMRLAVTMYSAKPCAPEVRALAQRLGAQDPHPPAHILGPATALADLDAAVASTLAGRMMETAEDRASLRDDLARAIDALGPATQAAADQIITDLRRSLSLIPERLKTLAGSQMLKGLIETSRAGLGTKAVAQAAWSDVLAAFIRDDWAQTWAETCELRLLQLGEIVEVGGGHWPHIADGLERILIGERLRTNEFSLVEFEEGDDPMAPVDASLEQRLQWCDQVLSREPHEGDVVVWLGFTNAMLTNAGYTEIGEIEFFAGQLWPEGIKEGWPDNDAERREEMAAIEDPRMMFLGDPPELPFVLARMHLGGMSVVQSTKRARRLIQDLIRAARPGSEWELMDGAMAYVRGDQPGWYGSALRLPREGPTNQFSAQFEPTSAGLEDLDDKFAGRLLADDPHLHAALRDIDWLERISELDDPAHRVGLGVRLIERLIPKEAHWTEVASHYLRDAWALNRIATFVADTGHNAVEIIENPMPVVGATEPWRQRLLPSRGTWYEISYEEIVKATPELIKVMPPYMLATRTVHEVAERTKDGSSILTWKDELISQFDQLLARLVRQRNLILHGGDEHDPVTETLKFFLAWVQGSLAHVAIAAVRREVPLTVQLEKRRAGVRKRWGNLEKGSAPIEALFDDGSEAG